jgi:hypothetical protein
MNPFKEWPRLFIVDRVVRVGDAVLCPYVPDGRLQEALSTLEDWSSAKIVFAHQTLDGVKMGPTVVDGVEKWPEQAPFLCSGHIHDKQYPQENLYYTGTPIPHSYGESNEKSIALFQVDDTVSYKEIPMEVCSKTIKYLTVAEAYSFMYESRPYHHLRLTVRGRPEENKAFRKSGEYRKLVAEGVKIMFDEPKVEKEERGTVKRVDEMLYDMVRGDASLLLHYHTYISPKEVVVLE